MVWRNRVARAVAGLAVVGLLLTAIQLVFSTAGSAAPEVDIVPAIAPVWTDSWSATAHGDANGFAQQTLRELVRPAVSGSVARIQLSNVFGDQPLVVADLHIAVATAGPAVAPGTDREITFGGRLGTTIPAGGTAVSDAVTFPVAAGSTVAVSVYLPGGTGSATTDRSAAPDTFVAAGDVSAAGTLSDPRPVDGYRFLTDLDVRDSAAGAN
ncbi:MAG TPA: hypothetical protein VHW44_11095 [Pseudonocardiaceae bacterium]|nr:hypothetical protein [Pseudonocardiaceae bacterium]